MVCYERAPLFEEGDQGVRQLHRLPDIEGCSGGGRLWDLLQQISHIEVAVWRSNCPVETLIHRSVSPVPRCDSHRQEQTQIVKSREHFIARLAPG